jgi:hypothetical protein
MHLDYHPNVRLEELKHYNEATALMKETIITYVLYINVYLYIHIYIYIPVVPHKAVAEVSKIGNL